MKKMAGVLGTALLVAGLVGCTGVETSSPDSSESTMQETISESMGESVTEPEVESIAEEKQEEASSEKEMTTAEFDSFLAESMPLAVTSTAYVVQDEEYKALYPDMLDAILVNNTQSDIKSAVVAFVAWDENNLPVKISGEFDFTDGDYVKTVNYDDINMIPGSTFGDSYGFSLAEDCDIETFKATIVSFETFENETWNNPYFDQWCDLYGDCKLEDGMTVEVDTSDMATA